MSTVTGEAVEADPLDADYWWRNIRSPVRFAEATGRLIGEGYRIFVEIGPTAILQSYLTDALRAAKADGRVLASLSRKPIEWRSVSGNRGPLPRRGIRPHVVAVVRRAGRSARTAALSLGAAEFWFNRRSRPPIR